MRILYLQVDCAGVSLLMTGSPHTSMPYAMHHLKPRPRAGVFLCPGLCSGLCSGWTVYRDSTWMCGAIGSVMHAIKEIAAGARLPHLHPQSCEQGDCFTNKMANGSGR